MPAPPAAHLQVDGDVVFPNTRYAPYQWAQQPQVTVPILPTGAGGGLMYLAPGPGTFVANWRPLWSTHPNVWGFGFGGDTPLHYTHRDDDHIYGVTGYQASAKLFDHTPVYTDYYNPNAYWTPPAPGTPPPPPPGADVTAVYGQAPATLVPTVYNVYKNKPYYYADLKVYDQMGKNRTGDDLAEDPDNPGEFLDPYDSADHPLTFLYDDRDPTGSNLANADWEPDGDQTRNQQVALVAANTERKRGIRMIARNMHSWEQIGVYSNWDAPGGQNVVDVSEDSLGAYAQGFVERYGRPPNFCKLYLHLEPADQYPAFGAVGYRPQPFRDFNLGDRVKVRIRKGYLDSGLVVMRIMGIKIGQADPDNNVTAELDCVPHTTDVSEISVVD